MMIITIALSLSRDVMPKTIVFISKLDSRTQSHWLSLLKEKLPDEIILLPHQISDLQVENVDIAIVANPDPNVLTRFSNLIWIQSLWAGVEQLISEGLSKNIKLVRLIDPQLSKTMAEAVLAWTLYLQRNMPEYAKQQIDKQWHQLPPITAKELRIGMLGAGTLSTAALQTLKKFDYQISCWSRAPKQLDGIKSYTGIDGLQSMLSNTDILINLLPLTQETHHLLDMKMLSQLPVGAKLINFSRGAIIDTQALLQLLKTGHLSHAVLDVFEHEPLSKSSPIWSNPSITVLPHISAPTNMSTAVEIVEKNVNMYRKSQVIPDFVNLELGY